MHGSGGYLNAWIDWNRDGDWLDAGEQIATDLAVPAGPFQFSLLPPVGLVSGQSFARFRLSSTQGLGPSGPAPDGEVEDSIVELSSNLPPTAVFGSERHVVTAGLIGRTNRLQRAIDISGPWNDVENPAAVGTIENSGVVLLKDLNPPGGTVFYLAVQQ